MTLCEKMQRICEEVNNAAVEREELVHCIALALLTRNNLFVLGDTGQAKSFAIDYFRKHITGSRQYSTVMSKQTKMDELFGRLDLSSIIPGNISKGRLEKDSVYQNLYRKLQDKMAVYTPGDDDKLDELKKCREETEEYRKALAEIHGGVPEILTKSKIPDADIVFVDELFKSNEAVLNALLNALNERTFTNEGVTYPIPVISFFSASNEIPNFSNPEEKILRPLYDRFQLRVKTEYVRDTDNRNKILNEKQAYKELPLNVCVTVYELEQMQQQVKAVTIPDSINALMDKILVELRKNGIAVSDRTYFNYGIIAQAEAWMSGREEVFPTDLSILVNYLWNKPEEISTISKIIESFCENPLEESLNAIVAKVHMAEDSFSRTMDKDIALVTFRRDVNTIYAELTALASDNTDSISIAAIQKAKTDIEDIRESVFKQTTFTYITLEQEQAMKKGA